MRDHGAPGRPRQTARAPHGGRECAAEQAGAFDEIGDGTSHDKQCKPKAEGREHRSAYIADDGFTASVVGRLPPPVAVPAWRGAAVALLWLCAAVAAILILPGVFDNVFRSVVAMAAPNSRLSPAAEPAVATMLS